MHRHLRLFRSRLYCSCFSWQFSQGQLDFHLFFSCFHGRAGGEDGCVYKLLLFLSSRHHALAITARQLTTLILPHRENKPPAP